MRGGILLFLSAIACLSAASQPIEVSQVIFNFSVEKENLQSGEPMNLIIEMMSRAVAPQFVTLWNNSAIAKDTFELSFSDRPELNEVYRRHLPILPATQLVICSEPILPGERVIKKYPITSQINTQLPDGSYSLRLDIRGLSVKETGAMENSEYKEFSIRDGLTFNVSSSESKSLKEVYRNLLKSIRSKNNYYASEGRMQDDFAFHSDLLLLCFAWGPQAVAEQLEILLPEKDIKELSQGLRLIAFQNILTYGTDQDISRILSVALSPDFVCTDEETTDPTIVWFLQNVPSAVKDRISAFSDFNMKCQHVIDPSVLQFDSKSSLR